MNSGTAAAMKTCPYCAEEILAAAIKCKHCGERLDGSAKIAAAPALRIEVSRLPSSPFRWGAPQFKPSVVFSYALAALLPTILMAAVAFEVHRDGRGDTFSHLFAGAMIAGIVGIPLYGALGAGFAGLFVVSHRGRSGPAFVVFWTAVVAAGLALGWRWLLDDALDFHLYDIKMWQWALFGVVSSCFASVAAVLMARVRRQGDDRPSV